MIRTSLIVALTLAAGGTFAAPVPVTTCGQVVATRSAELTQDLDCSGFAGDAVTMSNGGQLALNGFTLTADAARINNGVVCTRPCRVVGPGTLSGGNRAAFLYTTYGRITVDGVTITGAKGGVVGSRVTVRNSTLLDNDAGAVAYNPPFSSAYIRDSTIADSSERGVLSVRIRVVDSSVSGSGGACPPDAICCDLVAMKSVVLRGASMCGTSCANLQGSPTFGVCAND